MRVAATYRDVVESQFPTSAVKDGLPSDPGAGWITSAPIYSIDVRLIATKRIKFMHLLLVSVVHCLSGSPQKRDQG